MAARHGQPGRQAAERRDQVRRVAESSRVGMGPLGPDRRRRGRRHRGAQEGRWTGAAGPRQREPAPDAPAPQPRRRVPPVDLPPRHRVGETLVRGRDDPRRAEARRQQGLHDRCRDRYVRAGRRDRRRIVRAGLTTPIGRHIAQARALFLARHGRNIGSLTRSSVRSSMALALPNRFTEGIAKESR